MEKMYNMEGLDWRLSSVVSSCNCFMGILYVAMLEFKNKM